MFGLVRRYFKCSEVYGQIPKLTLAEHKRRAWGDAPAAYRMTEPAGPRKQWKPVQRWRRA